MDIGTSAPAFQPAEFEKILDKSASFCGKIIENYIRAFVKGEGMVPMIHQKIDNHLVLDPMMIEMNDAGEFRQYHLHVSVVPKDETFNVPDDDSLRQGMVRGTTMFAGMCKLLYQFYVRTGSEFRQLESQFPELTIDVEKNNLYIAEGYPYRIGFIWYPVYVKELPNHAP